MRIPKKNKACYTVCDSLICHGDRMHPLFMFAFQVLYGMNWYGMASLCEKTMFHPEVGVLDRVAWACQ